jgi:hypothetical protein
MSAIYRINHLERLPLKTPYPAQVARIQYIMSRLPRTASLIVDFTGVGRGIFDMLVDAGLSPVGVTISGGFNQHWDGNLATVPKSTLVSKLVARLHAGELFVHESLKDWPVLRRELLNFRPEVTRGGTETWNARSGEHDDLVLSLALATWYLCGARPFSGFMEYARQELRGQTLGGLEWAVGVDLGQSQDPTAIAVLSKIEGPGLRDVVDPHYRQETVAAA